MKITEIHNWTQNILGSQNNCEQTNNIEDFTVWIPET